MSHYQRELQNFIESVAPETKQDQEKAKAAFDGTLRAYQAKAADAFSHLGYSSSDLQTALTALSKAIQ